MIVAIGSAIETPPRTKKVPTRAANNPSSSFAKSINWALIIDPLFFKKNNLISGIALIAIEIRITPIAKGRFW